MTEKTIILDLNFKNKINKVNEGFYRTDFANKVYYILRDLGQTDLDIFGSGGLLSSKSGAASSLKIKGTPAQITAFFAALKNEKRYMDSYIKNGLNDSTTKISKYELDQAVYQFEYETGLKWPFKN